MPKHPQFKLYAAFWPHHRGRDRFDGTPRSTLDSCDSAWIMLRGDDNVPWGLRSMVSSVGLWVWWSNDGQMNLDVRLSDLHSADIRELTEVLPLMKRLKAKIPDRLFNEAPRCYVLRTLRAMGIHQATNYPKDDHISVHHLADAVGEAIDASIAQMQQRAA